MNEQIMSAEDNETAPNKMEMRVYKELATFSENRLFILLLWGLYQTANFLRVLSYITET